MLKLCRLISTVLVGGRGHQIQSSKGTNQGPFHQSLVPIGQAVLEKKIFKHFPIGSYVKTMSAQVS